MAQFTAKAQQGSKTLGRKATNVTSTIEVTNTPGYYCKMVTVEVNGLPQEVRTSTWGKALKIRATLKGVTQGSVALEELTSVKEVAAAYAAEILEMAVGIAAYEDLLNPWEVQEIIRDLRDDNYFLKGVAPDVKRRVKKELCSYDPTKSGEAYRKLRKLSQRAKKLWETLPEEILWISISKTGVSKEPLNSYLDLLSSDLLSSEFVGSLEGSSRNNLRNFKISSLSGLKKTTLMNKNGMKTIVKTGMSKEELMLVAKDMGLSEPNAKVWGITYLINGTLQESNELYATEEDAKKVLEETSTDDAELTWVEESYWPFNYSVEVRPQKYIVFDNFHGALEYQLRNGGVYTNHFRRHLVTAADQVKELEARGIKSLVALGEPDNCGGYEDAWKGSTRPHSPKEMLEAISTHKAYFADILDAKDLGWTGNKI